MAKLHPADQAEIEKIASAAYFTVHLRTGPQDKTTKTAKTLAAAIKVADSIGATPGGRRPMIYAVTADDRTALVPAAMIAQKREDAAKPLAPPRKANRARPHGRRAEIAEKAARGVLPPVPDFSAKTHERYRAKLAVIVKLVKAGDVAALRAIEIKPYSTSPKAMARYRDLAVIALKARTRPSAGEKRR